MFNRKLLWGFGVPLLVIGVVIAAIAMWPERSTEDTTKGEWTCSMDPHIRRNKPGQCPICGMNLIPVSQLSKLADTEKRAGIETEPVKYRELFKEVHTVGKLDYNESRVQYIAARVAGRVDRIYAGFTGIRVNKGHHLVDIYSPDLFIAQAELLRFLESYEAARGDRSFAASNLEAGRTKLRLLGVLPEQIAEIEKSRKTSTHLTIYAPLGGTVIEKNVRAGQYVKDGDALYRIADLDPIWLYLDIYEFDYAWVSVGQPVEVTLEAFPTETFRGIVTFIDPFLDDKSRTVKVRVNLKNPERKLKPAMYASALIRVRLLPDGTPEPTGLEGKYICPMHPEVVQDAPGRCSVCEMQLERVSEAERTAATTHEAKYVCPMHPEVVLDMPGHCPTCGLHTVPTTHEGHQAKETDRRGDQDNAKTNQGAKPAGVLAIRATGVLDTGRRKVTYRRRNDGAYELVALQVGPLADGKDDAGQTISYFPVLKGLKQGDRVVVRGGFLLDSQQQISGMPSLLYKEGRSATALHSGHGAMPSAPAQTPSEAHKH